MNNNSIIKTIIKHTVAFPDRESHVLEVRKEKQEEKKKKQATNTVSSYKEELIPKFVS